MRTVSPVPNVSRAPSAATGAAGRYPDTCRSVIRQRQPVTTWSRWLREALASWETWSRPAGNAT
jgi:hypothetical protein